MDSNSESSDSEGAPSEPEAEPPIAATVEQPANPREADQSVRPSRPFQRGDLIEINQAGVNCRAWMSTTAPVRSILKKGARATILSEPFRFDGHTWLKVRLLDSEMAGSVAARYLTLIESAADPTPDVDSPPEAPPEQPRAYQAGDLLTTTARILLRAGPGKEAGVISGIDPSTRGTVLGEPVSVDSMAWVPVRFPAGSGWIAAPYTQLFRQKGKWIEADLSTQTLTAWLGIDRISSSLMSSGKPGYDTPLGTFTILEKIPTQRLRARVRDEAWDIPGVPWIMVFRAGGFYIHSVYWHEEFGKPVSHGCVTLPVDFAEWLYEWAPLGTRIWVHL